MWKRMKITGALVVLALASPLKATGSGFSNMYVLGDSLSDQGNLFAATWTLSGQYYPFQFAIPRPDHYFNGRFSNGPIYADVLASEMGVSLTPSLFGGNNFAFGGTRTEYNTVEYNDTKPFPFSELDQANLFPKGVYNWTLDLQRADFVARGVDDTGGLYVVFSGSNDLVDIISIAGACAPLGCNPFEVAEAYIPGVIAGVNSVIAAFVQAGAQEILVPNMPNLGVIPGFTDPEVGPQPQTALLAEALSWQYNQAFDAMLATWEGTVNIIPLNIFGLLTAVVDDPGSFGFTNATEACYTGFVAPGQDGVECGDLGEDPDEYVFWDLEHPTTALHAVLADISLASFVPDMLEYLSYQVITLDSTPKVKNSLIRKLDGAASKIEAGKIADAVQKLEDFIDKVSEKQEDDKIAEGDATSMIMRAEKIIALLEH